MISVEFGKDATFGELLHPAMKIQNQDEADEYLERLIRHGRLHGQTRLKAEEIALANLGYWTGYYDQETASRVFRLFNCSHPIFGTKRNLSTLELLDAGRKRGCDDKR